MDGNKMSATKEWQEKAYKETFEEEMRGLTRRRESDPSCKLEDLEGTLKHLYVLGGCDHDGRGTLQDILISARIAAHESFIAEWRLEKGQI